MAISDPLLSNADRCRLRELARRVAEIAALPIQAERVAEWKRHNDRRPGRGMILVFPEGAWRELLPESALGCEAERAREMEAELLRRIYAHEHFDSDNVVTADFEVHKAMRSTGWGLIGKWRYTDVLHGARGFDPVLHERADLERLTTPRVSVDEAATQRRLEEARDIFGDILNVRLTGVSCVSFHLMAQYTELRGLAQALEDFIEQPELVHGALERLTAGNLSLIEQYEALGLFGVNNDNTYHSSGGNGFTDALPGAGFDAAHVRPSDLWASAESQELSLVSPAMHKEFAIDYERRLLAPFARAGYGCCEALTRKLDDVLSIENMWRVSISPFADVDVCAPRLGNQAIFSWKPHPAELVGRWDEDGVARYVRHACEVARDNDCVFEMILKDTHTCESHPERFDAWTRIARRTVREVWPD